MGFNLNIPFLHEITTTNLRSFAHKFLSTPRYVGEEIVTIKQIIMIINLIVKSYVKVRIYGEIVGKKKPFQNERA